MIRKNLKNLVAMAAVGAVAVAGVAGAAVENFDPDLGTGFVGKGDVQIPFGWNNKQLQDNAQDVDFVYVDQTEYEFTCEQTTITEEEVQAGRSGQTRTVKKKVTVKDVSSAATAVSYDSKTATRKNPKGDANGFILSGYDANIPGDPVPAEGDPCKMDDGTAGIINGDQITVSSTAGDTLSATHSSKSPAVVWADGVSLR